MHRRNDHDAVCRHPSWIDLIHPIMRLTKVMVRITTARPMTERHRRGDACFARVNHASVFSRHYTEVQKSPLRIAEPSMTSHAVFAKRNVFDISLGHVWSVRGD